MSKSQHFVAIVGGAVAGAEAAFQLSQRGIRSVVFEMNNLPYGKIEDGLPKWHVKLRNKEEQRINEKLNHPLVSFVPGVKLGRDIGVHELAHDWGLSMVFIATGAWRDRPLPVPGVDEYVNKGLVYQNSFIYWFNHYHEPEYEGPRYEIADRAVIIGGGLASIDVAKALMIETVASALQDRGYEANLFTLERGIAKVLDQLGLSLADLGVRGCSLYYRRRIKDMPLTPMETDTPEKRAKAERVREKVLSLAKERFLFQVIPQHVPVDKIVENGRLEGLVFQQTEIVDGRAKAIPGTEITVRAPLFISSIGSLPEPIKGIPEQWGVYKVHEDEACRIEGFDNVFALGNAVTGRGNIKESMKHSQEMTEQIIEAAISDRIFEEGYEEATSNAALQVEKLVQILEDFPPRAPEQIQQIESRVLALQKKTGYDGNFDQWIRLNLPPRLEDMVGGH